MDGLASASGAGADAIGDGNDGTAVRLGQTEQHHSSIDARFDDERFECRTPVSTTGAGGLPPLAGGGAPRPAATAREAELMAQLEERDARLQTLRAAHKASNTKNAQRILQLHAALAEMESRLAAAGLPTRPAV